MSQLEVNSIDKYSGNNLSVGSQLNLKSYTTTQRDALTSVAGDMIYNTTETQPQVYNGSAWVGLGTIFVDVDYLVIACWRYLDGARRRMLDAGFIGVRPPRYAPVYSAQRTPRFGGGHCSASQH